MALRQTTLVFTLIRMRSFFSQPWLPVAPGLLVSQHSSWV